VSRPLKIVLWIFATLFLLFFLSGLAPWSLAVLIHLVLGWITHASTVLPKVTVNWSGVGMLVACLAPAAAIGHSFCRWLWHGTGHVDPWRLRWSIAGLGVLVLMFAAGMAFTAVAHQTGWLLRAKEPLLTSSSQASFERSASTSLKMICKAQMDFAFQDSDGNKVRDYWRTDIAGLYGLKGENGGPIDLIEPSIAIADEAPKTNIDGLGAPGAKMGYWFRAIGFKNETTVDRTRFAVLARPEYPSFGKFYFIISHDAVVYRKRTLDVPPPDVYPDDPEKDGWQKLD
jgi:hypothetical protein